MLPALQREGAGAFNYLLLVAAPHINIPDKDDVAHLSKPHTSLEMACCNLVDNPDGPHMSWSFPCLHGSAPQMAPAPKWRQAYQWVAKRMCGAP